MKIRRGKDGIEKGGKRIGQKKRKGENEDRIRR